jgi:isochorismate pyruvate lyase|tara:strand:- start:415 stop:729 length:315 start_codon:yes stop_codon:yes gene_type:complete
MNETVKRPEDCETMAEVRVGVDTIDRELMRLMATRFGYMRAAARIKPERGHVRDEARKAQVIDNVRADARREGIPEVALGDIWDALVEASIAYEMVEWERLRSS